MNSNVDLKIIKLNLINSSGVTDYTSKAISINATMDLIPDGNFSIGNTVAKSANIQLHTSLKIDKNSRFDLLVSSDGTTTNWVNLSTLFIDTRSAIPLQTTYSGLTSTNLEYMYKFSLFDEMLYSQNQLAGLGTTTAYTTTYILQQIFNKMKNSIISNQLYSLGTGQSPDFTLDLTGVANYSITPITDPFVMRDMLGYIASMSGGNFIIDSNRVLKLIVCNANYGTVNLATHDVLDFTLINDLNKIDGINVVNDKTLSITGSSDNTTIQLDNPYLTSSIVASIKSIIFNFQYEPFSVTNCYFSTVPILGSKLTYTNIHNIVVNSYIFSVKLNSLNSGILSIEATGYGKSESEFPSQNFNSAVINTSVSNLHQNQTFVTNIQPVIKETVLSVQTLQATASWFDDTFINRLETNLTDYIVTPNITITINADSSKNYAFDGNYTARTVATSRNYIKIENIQIQFIEDDLVKYSTPVLPVEVTPIKVNGRQIYFTGIADDPDAYLYYTFTNPLSKYPNMTTENAQMYVINKLAVSKSLIKESIMFQQVTLNDGSTTLEPITTIGAGTSLTDSTMGKFTQTKDLGSMILNYASGTIPSINAKIEFKDDGRVYINGVIVGESEMPNTVNATGGNLDLIYNNYTVGYTYTKDPTLGYINKIVDKNTGYITLFNLNI